MQSYKIEKDLLKQYIARIERIEEDKSKVQEELKETYSNAKSHGFDIKALKQIVKIRKIDTKELVEHEAILDVYKEALGMVEPVLEEL